MMKRGIVIAFPGIRYTCRQQLMQDCLAFYTARGYETLCLDFAGVPFDGTADMGRAAELALPSIGTAFRRSFCRLYRCGLPCKKPGDALRGAYGEGAGAAAAVFSADAAGGNFAGTAAGC